MQERIYEILTFLLKKFFSKEKQMLDQNLITQDLVEKGFEIDEIQEAFKILESTKPLEVKENEFPCKSFRMFSDYEQFRLSLDAQGALILLEQMGIVNQYQLEDIIDRVLSIDLPEITRREIALIAIEVVAESSGVIVARDVWNFFGEEGVGEI